MADTCVIGVLLRLTRTQTNTNTGGAPAPIDHHAMRINHLALSLENKIYIFNAHDVLAHTLAPSTWGDVNSPARAAPFLMCFLWLLDLGA